MGAPGDVTPVFPQIKLESGPKDGPTFGDLEVSDLRRLRALQDENAKLKQLLADAMLDNAGQKDLLTEKWQRPPPSAKRSRISRRRGG